MLTAKSFTTHSTITPWLSMPIPDKRVWETQVGEIKLGETTTMAPIVVRNMVFTGISGGELGVRGRLMALDLKSGKIRWIAYNTGPDKDTLIGPGLQSFLPQRSRARPGHEKLDARSMEDGRRCSMGLDFLRPRTQSHLLRHWKSRSLECGYASRRQQMVVTIWARDPETGRLSGPIKSCRMMPGTMTRSWRTFWSTCPGKGG